MALQFIGQIKKSTLINEISSVIRESIISGAIPPDTRLTEQELAKQLSVSRGSLREALRLLESEGLVVDIPRRGFYVVDLSSKDIEEVYSLRLLLELEAVRRVITHATPEDLNSLEEIMTDMTGAAQAGDLTRVVRLDVDFHRRLWAIADHKLLQETLEGFILKISMYLSVQTHLYEDLNAGIADHDLLLAALRQRDEAQAVSILTRHINDALQVVLNYARKS
jgi:GntR family transcriptional regulator, gluconate operon transcriptional repressor